MMLKCSRGTFCTNSIKAKQNEAAFCKCVFNKKSLHARKPWVFVRRLYNEFVSLSPTLRPHPPLLSSSSSPLPSPSLLLLPFPAVGTTASSNAGAMNSLTSLGTLQGLAGATVGLNNINALAGSINSEYSPCHQPLHLHLHLHPHLPLTNTIHFQQPQPASGRRETTCHGGWRSSELDFYGFLHTIFNSKQIISHI